MKILEYFHKNKYTIQKHFLQDFSRLILKNIKEQFLV